MREFRLAKKRLTVSVGESVRVMRELQELNSMNRILANVPEPGLRLETRTFASAETSSVKHLLCRI